MIPIVGVEGKEVAVFGLGKAGRAAVEALLASGATVWAWDDGEASRQALEVHSSLRVVPVSQMPWERIAELVLSPGVPLTHPVPHEVVKTAHAAAVPIVGEVELLYRSCPEAAYIAITGTNGKSTTTALIGHLLHVAGKQVQVGGNIGNAALTLEPMGTEGIYVLEMSSFQLDLVRTVRNRVAVWLNISPDHIDRHGDLTGYITAKRHIFERQSAGDVAVVGVDDRYSREVADALEAEGKEVERISAKSGRVYLEGESVMGNPALRGAHNRQNVAAAVAAVEQFGLSEAEIREGLKTFPGLAHRMEPVGEVNGVAFINDSKATNADAAARALASFTRIYWIAGGKGKEGDDLEVMAPYFDRVVKAYLIGAAADDFATFLEGRVVSERCMTLERAAETAYAEAVAEGQGGVVLLSPACASYDQFQNFEHRGEVFRGLVQKLATKYGAGLGVAHAT